MHHLAVAYSMKQHMDNRGRIHLMQKLNCHLLVLMVCLKDEEGLDQLVCSKIIGVQLTKLSLIRNNKNKSVVQITKCIMKQGDHVMSSGFILMASGWRYYAPLRKTNRYLNAFIPSVFRLMKARFVLCRFISFYLIFFIQFVYFFPLFEYLS